MPSRETLSPSQPKSSFQETLMEKFKTSLGNKHWKVEEEALKGGILHLYMDDPTETKEMVYSDYGDDPEGRILELIYYGEDESRFTFSQIIGEKNVENHIEIGPFEDDPEYIDYGPDGRMEQYKGRIGYPRKIDMDLTAIAFIKQVTEARFTKPLLFNA